ncbi:DNA mismatch repair endonuclease MutL [Allomuricauda sp. SCSIO 65647]|uniref:DNA mismatch repair endonuclease MutL n=1 Tax=Allomuricauda sp. SCSIO 65647 TaxID=2908843 RepID=UPI001F4681BA|nr:DNA mismatch repair endonuclease MutL [Muricauda sp. SCSIO 65647]UJH67894.1 DNA mismatch repair endonuclease MutL [Muricauda sp. SCSIO 65647]
MADIVRLLPDHVANQIAAGEVVQRPASVVKELVENAIDAKASVIKLIVKEGGKSLIQVVDDGVGMSVTDARLSFERHATSKITSADDLFALHTKGFRGEALASIAAIAHVDMLTRTANDELGTQLRIEGSKVVSQEPVATPKGTSVAVKNLFFNIPARRNFLKSNQVELRHITDEFHRVALAHPMIEFHFYNNGSEFFNLPKTNLRQRIVHVFGLKMNERLVPVDEETQVAKISGFICKPEYAKKSRGAQFFFANNRFIKSPYLHHAVIAAFEGLLKPERVPGYFLYLEVPPNSIDINIHPTKTEVKFDDENTLYAILRSAIKHALGQFSVAPALDFERDPNLDTPYAFQHKGAILPKVTVDADFNPFQEKQKGGGQQTYQKVSTKGWQNLYPGLEGIASQNFELISQETTKEAEELFDERTEKISYEVATFQYKRKYIVTTIKSGMLFIDQNRAHQRVLFEQFLKEMTVNEGISQQLLFPLKLDFSNEELRILKEIKGSLNTMGFSFKESEDGVVVVEGIPLSAEHGDIQRLLNELISNYREDISQGELSQAEILARTLSKALAVKNGEVLATESQLALVNDLFNCKEPMLSPFQKMTYVTISEGDIENKFI